MAAQKMAACNLVFGLVCAVQSAASGHPKPMGKHAPDAYRGPIRTFPPGQLPTTKQFYETLASGWGEPALFKGAAKNMPAMGWTDDVLAKKFGSHAVDVEYSKKETRNADVRRISLREFLAQYNASDVYTVTDISRDMMRDVELMPFLSCGGFTNLLDMVTMWMSSGGTRSVLHNDDQDNINCLFAGKKRMIFWHPKYRSQIQSAEYGWHDQNAAPVAGGGYGAFAKYIDVDAVDLAKYPGWAELQWYDGNMEPGDCLFIPHKWYHTVASFERNLAINVWWWRNNANGRNTRQDVSSLPNDPFSDMQCQPQAEGKEGSADQPPFKLHDCSFGYEFQPPGQWRRTRTMEHTSCARGKAARGGASIRIADHDPQGLQGQPDQPDQPDEGEAVGEGEAEGDNDDERDEDADDDDEDYNRHGEL